MSILLNFIYAHFFEGLMIAAFGAFSKVLINYFGNDRTQKIKDMILTSMLWAEEQFGIGTGPQKWTEAWNKLTELLQVQGIKLNDKEMSVAQVQMKSNIPEINALVYSALPEISTITRAPYLNPSESEKLIATLRAKYPTQEE